MNNGQQLKFVTESRASVNRNKGFLEFANGNNATFENEHFVSGGNNDVS